jgi:hypothetical protein
MKTVLEYFLLSFPEYVQQGEVLHKKILINVAKKLVIKLFGIMICWWKSLNTQEPNYIKIFDWNV